MRPLLPALAAAALILGAASAVRADGGKLDLSGLNINGPSPDVGDSSASSGPEKEMVLAAINDFTDDAGAQVALKYFAPMFGSKTTPDGRTVAFDRQQLNDAAALLTRMIGAGQIKITKPQGGGAAGAWTPDITNGALSGGTFEVGSAQSVRSYGQDPRNFSHLFQQDQFANTILHETTHMFYSVITISLGFTPQSQPSVVEDFKSTVFWNGRRPASLCSLSGDCPYPHDKRPCMDIMCYHWKITNHGYGQGNATEYAARVISQEMSETSGGQAYRRILEPAFR